MTADTHAWVIGMIFLVALFLLALQLALNKKSLSQSHTVQPLKEVLLII